MAYLLILSALLTLTFTKLIVQSPAALQKYFQSKYINGNVPFSIANYGVIPYGKTISGQVDTPSFLENCIYEDLPQYSRKKILLVQRNDCTFTQKSINVQKQGGKLAVIIDSRQQNPGRIIMIDDGKGYQVQIPTILISKDDGAQMLKYIQNGLVLAVEFQVQAREKADVQLWLDITNHRNFIFLRNLQAYLDRISDHVNLNIGYPTTRCYTDCSQSDCFYDGKYCRTSLNFWNVQNGGKELIRQQLRQYFLFNNNRNKWWQYMLKFDEQCYDLATYPECSTKIMKKLQLDYDKINNQVNYSFKPTENQVLKQMSELKYNSSLFYYPSVMVNGFVYRGNTQPYQVFELICASLTPVPQGCDDYAQPDNSHIAVWITFGVISSIIFIIFLICCYRRIARRQLTASMNKQVNQLVNQYITMYQNQKFKDGMEMTRK